MTELTVRQPPALSLLIELEREGKLTANSLVITEQIGWLTYEALCRYLGSLHDSSNWWLGDLFAYGEDAFGEEAAQAIEASGKSPDMITRCVAVAGRIPPRRRRAALSWSHHREVSYLEPAEADAWLTRAEEQGWSRRDLHAALQGEIAAETKLSCPQCGGKGWVPA